MISLALLKYLENQAKVSGQLRELMAHATKLLQRDEEQNNMEKELLEDNLILTMDVYDSEFILQQLKPKFEQSFVAQEYMNIIYKQSIELCQQIQNFDWNGNLRCKLELVKLQCENEVRKLSEEQGKEEQRKNELEQRPIVQMAYAAKREVFDVQAKINNCKDRESEYKAQFLNQLRELRNEYNANIVYLVKGSKEIACVEQELETLKRSHDNRMNELLKLKQQLQPHNGEFPDSTGNTEVEGTLPKLDFSPTTLEPFPQMGNVDNATTVGAEQKKPSFLELFKKWESERQMQFDQLMNAIANTMPESQSDPAISGIETLDVKHITTNHIDESLINDSLNTTPRSILRRPYAIEEQNEFAVIPKKRVRFAESEDDFVTGATFNIIENDNAPREPQIDSVGNETYLIEPTAIAFQSDTETIEIFSTAEDDEKEVERADNYAMQKVKKPVVVKANKLLKKAKLMGSQKLANKVAKPSKSAFDIDKPKIEIQECRIVKPAGTKLPTKIPVELSPDPKAPISPKNHNTNANALQATKSEIQVFKTPQKPLKRKAAQVPEPDPFYREFVQQQTASSETSEDDNNTKDETTKATEKSKRKKTEMDFDRFLRENLMGSNESESENDPAKLTDDGFFAVQTSDEKNDNDDFFSFDFDDSEDKRKTNDFFM